MSKTTKFWSWFLENEFVLRKALDYKHKSDQYLFDDLNQQLCDYCDFFGFEIIGREVDTCGKYTLTISCDGRKEYFVKLQHLVDSAPIMNNWIVKAFIEPKGNLEDMLKHPFEFQECTIVPNTLAFYVCHWFPQGVYNLVISLPLHLSSVGEEKLKSLLYMVFQDIWGEKFVGQRIQDVFFHFKKDPNEEYLDLRDLELVLEHFDEFFLN